MEVLCQVTAFILVLCLIQTNGKKFTEIQLLATRRCSYTDEIYAVNDAHCAVKCALIPGCKRFHHRLKSCFIINECFDSTMKRVMLKSFWIDESGFGMCCNPSYTVYLQLMSCLKTYDKEATWTQARDWCEEDGGHIATMKHDDALLTLPMIRTTGAQYWLGGQIINGAWYWVDGEPMDMTMGWYPNEPNDQGECLHFASYYNQMGADPCSQIKFYLCEMNL